MVPTVLLQDPAENSGFSMYFPLKLVLNPWGKPQTPAAALQVSEQDSWRCIWDLLSCHRVLLDCSQLFKVLVYLRVYLVCLEDKTHRDVILRKSLD